MEATTKKIMEVETFEETTEKTSKTTSEKTDGSINAPGFIGPSGFSFPIAAPNDTSTVATATVATAGEPAGSIGQSGFSFPIAAPKDTSTTENPSKYPSASGSGFSFPFVDRQDTSKATASSSLSTCIFEFGTTCPAVTIIASESGGSPLRMEPLPPPKTKRPYQLLKDKRKAPIEALSKSSASSWHNFDNINVSNKENRRPVPKKNKRGEKKKSSTSTGTVALRTNKPVESKKPSSSNRGPAEKRKRNPSPHAKPNAGRAKDNTSKGPTKKNPRLRRSTDDPQKASSGDMSDSRSNSNKSGAEGKDCIQASTYADASATADLDAQKEPVKQKKKRSRTKRARKTRSRRNRNRDSRRPSTEVNAQNSISSNIKQSETQHRDNLQKPSSGPVPDSRSNSPVYENSPSGSAPPTQSATNVARDADEDEEIEGMPSNADAGEDADADSDEEMEGMSANADEDEDEEIEATLASAADANDDSDADGSDEIEGMPSNTDADEDADSDEEMEGTPASTDADSDSNANGSEELEGMQHIEEETEDTPERSNIDANYDCDEEMEDNPASADADENAEEQVEETLASADADEEAAYIQESDNPCPSPSDRNTALPDPLFRLDGNKRNRFDPNVESPYGKLGLICMVDLLAKTDQVDIVRGDDPVAAVLKEFPLEHIACFFWSDSEICDEVKYKFIKDVIGETGDLLRGNRVSGVFEFVYKVLLQGDGENDLPRRMQDATANLFQIVDGNQIMINFFGKYQHFRKIRGDSLALFVSHEAGLLMVKEFFEKLAQGAENPQPIEFPSGDRGNSDAMRAPNCRKRAFLEVPDYILSPLGKKRVGMFKDHEPTDADFLHNNDRYVKTNVMKKIRFHIHETAMKSQHIMLGSFRPKDGGNRTHTVMINGKENTITDPDEEFGTVDRNKVGLEKLGIGKFHSLFTLERRDISRKRRRYSQNKLYRETKRVFPFLANFNPEASSNDCGPPKVGQKR